MGDMNKPSSTDADDDDDVPSSEGPNDERDIDEEDSGNPGAASPLRSVDQPIGEGRKNLRRREEWFRRRSGDGS
jgi:hypothetical protein